MSSRHDQPNPYLARAAASTARADSGVEAIDTVECWRLLQRASIGRFAVEGADGAPDVFPMNYLVREGAIYVRSAPGGKLRSVADRPGIAFEIDGASPTHYWSVVVRGTARRLDDDTEIEASGVLELTSLSPTPKHDFLRITPKTVTGRRFARHHRAVDPAPLAAPESAAPEGSPDKPEPIPHMPPLRESMTAL